MQNDSYTITAIDLSVTKNCLKILSDISLSFKDKTLNTIIGLNGSGKSTLLKTFCNLEIPDSGSVFIKNREIKTLNRKEIAKTITFLPQNIVVSAPFKVKDIIFMSRFPYKKSFLSYSSEDTDAVVKAMELTNTLQFEKRDINSLSGGERQKVFLAAVLAQETPIILLDEPFNGLDIKATSEIVKILMNIKSEMNKTIIMALHDISMAKNISDTIIALSKGMLIFSKPAHEVTTEEIIRNVFEMEKIF